MRRATWLGVWLGALLSACTLNFGKFEGDLAASCTNGEPDPAETDVDCGGPCPPCDDGRRCIAASDCVSQLCRDGTCAPCMTAADCADAPGTFCDGGRCIPQREVGEACSDRAACTSGACSDGLCCSRACDGTCESCLAAETGMADGTCAFVHRHHRPRRTNAAPMCAMVAARVPRCAVLSPRHPAASVPCGATAVAMVACATSTARWLRAASTVTVPGGICVRGRVHVHQRLRHDDDRMPRRVLRATSLARQTGAVVTPPSAARRREPAR